MIAKLEAKPWLSRRPGNHFRNYWDKPDWTKDGHFYAACTYECQDCHEPGPPP